MNKTHIAVTMLCIILSVSIMVNVYQWQMTMQISQYNSLLSEWMTKCSKEIHDSGVAQVLNVTGTFDDKDAPILVVFYATVYFYVSNETQHTVEYKDEVRFKLILSNGTIGYWYPKENGCSIPSNYKSVWTDFWHYPDAIRSFCLQFNAIAELEEYSSPIYGTWMMKLPTTFHETSNETVFFSTFENAFYKGQWVS